MAKDVNAKTWALEPDAEGYRWSSGPGDENLPPVWSGAPSSLNVQAGSLVNFYQWASDPNNDQLTYALRQTPTGYSITSAGVLTVGPGNGTVVVRATDPSGLFAETSCSVTVLVASSVKWNPGHYVQILRSPSWYDFNTHKPVWDSIANEPSVKGGCVSYNWAMLEPTRGSYDFSRIYQDLNYLSGLSTPKKLWIRLKDHNGASSRTDTTFWPQWAINISGPELVYNVTASRSAWRRWNAAYMDYYVQLLQALGAEFDGHPNVEGIWPIQETAIGLGVYRPTDYSSSNDITQMARLWKATIAAFPTTNVKASINFHDDTAGTIAAAYAAGRVLFGGPDITNPYDNSYYIDAMRRHMAYSGGTEYRNLAGYCAGIEASEMGYDSVGPPGGYTPTQIWSYANGNMYASHFLWDRMMSSSNPAQNWDTGILPFTRANPNPTHNTRPSNY